MLFSSIDIPNLTVGHFKMSPTIKLIKMCLYFCYTLSYLQIKNPMPAMSSARLAQRTPAKIPAPSSLVV